MHWFHLTLLLTLSFSAMASEQTQLPSANDPAASTALGGWPLRQILITSEGLEAAQTLQPQPGGGFVVLAPSIAPQHLQPLTERLSPGASRLIDEPLLAAIAQVVETYFRQHDLPVATAIIPPQSIAGGVIRVALLPGTIRNIKFEGNRWFSEKLLRDKLRIEEGGTLRLSAIDQSLAWTNASSFRHVRVHVQPIAGSGEVDLLVGVKELAPWRVFASIDNAGNDVLGVNRVIAGVTAANLWGRDHQLTYQYITSDFSDVFQAHTADYRVPLPWRHHISLSVSYLEANPSLFDGLFVQEGRSTNVDLKYSLSFRRKKWRFDTSFGLSAKQSNNNLEYGGQPVLGSVTDSYLAVASASAVRNDTDLRGRWTLSAALNASPGDINSRNTNEHYEQSRSGASAQFLYGQMSVERITKLTPSLASSLRFTGQISSTNLLPFEQFSLGGANTVRGYKERILSGDHGYLITHELHQQLFSRKVHPRIPEVSGTGVLFWDYGRTILHQTDPGSRRSDYLASVGIGFRGAVSSTVSASLDHAWQLEDVELPGEKHSRTHLRLMVSF